MIDDKAGMPDKAVLDAAYLAYYTHTLKTLAEAGVPEPLRVLRHPRPDVRWADLTDLIAGR